MLNINTISIDKRLEAHEYEAQHAYEGTEGAFSSGSLSYAILQSKILNEEGMDIVSESLDTSNAQFAGGAGASSDGGSAPLKSSAMDSATHVGAAEAATLQSGLSGGGGANGGFDALSSGGDGASQTPGLPPVSTGSAGGGGGGGSAGSDGSAGVDGQSAGGGGGDTTTIINEVVNEVENITEELSEIIGDILNFYEDLDIDIIEVIEVVNSIIDGTVTNVTEIVETLIDNVFSQISQLEVCDLIERLSETIIETKAVLTELIGSTLENVGSVESIFETIDVNKLDIITEILDDVGVNLDGASLSLNLNAALDVAGGDILDVATNTQLNLSSDGITLDNNNNIELDAAEDLVEGIADDMNLDLDVSPVFDALGGDDSDDTQPAEDGGVLDVAVESTLQGVGLGGDDSLLGELDIGDEGAQDAVSSVVDVVSNTVDTVMDMVSEGETPDGDADSGLAPEEVVSQVSSDISDMLEGTVGDNEAASNLLGAVWTPLSGGGDADEGASAQDDGESESEDDLDWTENVVADINETYLESLENEPNAGDDSGGIFGVLDGVVNIDTNVTDQTMSLDIGVL